LLRPHGALGEVDDFGIGAIGALGAGRLQSVHALQHQGHNRQSATKISRARMLRNGAARSSILCDLIWLSAIVQSPPRFGKLGGRRKIGSEASLKFELFAFTEWKP
jgi:hypothetical protein